MYQSNRAVPLPLRSINSTTFTGSYLPVGDAFESPVRLLSIKNNTTVVVTISFDGVTDHDFIPIGSFVLYDFGTNRGTSADALDLPEATQISVKAAAGTGSLFVTSFAAVNPTFTIPL